MKGLEEELTLQKFKLMIDGLEHQYCEMEEAEEVYSIDPFKKLKLWLVPVEKINQFRSIVQLEFL